ncbi:HDOD domain protein [mine drainage metagenome]|uniref:HDOD domain protein n=1 Tax=mine drainage metagenome TaxID=410659 RepID=A0A1J5NYN6_9ZZZZ
MVASSTSLAGFHSDAGFDLGKFWLYSLDCAKVARSLADLVRQNHQAAFTCGLLHGVGELVMRAAMSEAVALDAEAQPFEFKRWRCERRALGFCYTEVSAGLTRQWHLPKTMHDALLFAHAPLAGDALEPLAGVMHLAVWRTRARHAGMTGNAMTVTFPSLVAEVLGLDIDMVLQQDPIDWSAQ